MIRSNDTVLFQGDSITDCGRDREAPAPNDLAGLGCGYAKTVAGALLAERPADALSIYNRGIGGNRVVDLYARWKEDALNLRPDVLSILVGVNDTVHELVSGCGVSSEKFERVYRQLLEETREALPNVRFVLCEPFLLPCDMATEEWFAELAKRRGSVRRLAEIFEARFVPFQRLFDDALELAPPAYWAPDGVHPTAAGHTLMAREWTRIVTG